jgi:hypothetical protein
MVWVSCPETLYWQGRFFKALLRYRYQFKLHGKQESGEPQKLYKVRNDAEHGFIR